MDKAGDDRTVARRRVFYIPGYDPFHPRRYRELYRREGAEQAIKSRGGKSPGSVSAKTFAVVVGAEPGASKVNKAGELGIPVLDEAGFEILLATGNLPA